MKKYKNKKILAVIPARGGSKGIPLKNLIKIHEKTLIEYVAEVVHEFGFFATAVVSTDSLLIADEAKRVGLQVPFMRPENISGDRIGDLDVLKHALKASEQFYNTNYDLVVMLQPTSPLRNATEVKFAIDFFIDGKWDTVWTLSESDLKYHPYKAIDRANNGNINYFCDEGKDIIARQQLNQLYHRNGVAYVLKRDVLITGKSLMGLKSGGVVLEREHISIDTLDDVRQVEDLL